MENEQKTTNSAQRDDARPRRGAARGGRRPGRSGEREKPEFDHKLVKVRRVARVVAGGRRFSFSVVLIAGNRKGRVGVGIGKASDTQLAIDKALRSAKKHMITLALTKEGSIPHEVRAKYCSARVLLKPSPNRGMVAGSAVRTVLSLGGVGHVNAKLLSRTKNSLNIARATIGALSQLSA